MLAFDLETTGLDMKRDIITCAAVYDPDAGVERVFFFTRGDSPDEFMRLLDEASSLCAFNGAAFDIPFIATQFSPPLWRVAAWRLKLHDAFVACKWGLGVTFPLQALLEHNGLPGKTGSGKDAIRQFEQGLWDELGEYCMHDTKVTHSISSRPLIVVPRCDRLLLTVYQGSFVARHA